MEQRQTQIPTALLVLLSATLSVLICLCGAYIFREQLANFLIAQTPVKTMVATTTEPVVAAVAKVNPAVVSVVVTKDVPIYERYYESIDPWGFFGGIQVPRLRERGTQEQEVGGGTGFIVDQSGLIVTNHHVVSDEAARYSILLNTGEDYEVDVLASDLELDIAVLKISEPVEGGLSTVTFGDSDGLELGQTVIAIGNALAEFQNSISVGVVSGLSRSIVASDMMGHSEQLHEVIQTDAAINPGNSGGPLLNINGEVVGMNVATSRGADNIGFAIPAALVKQVVDSVKQYGEIIRPYLGVRFTTVTARLATVHNLPVAYGALVVAGETTDQPAVLPDSPAAKAGIKEGDVIVAIDGETLQSSNLSTILRTKAVGEKISVEVLREGEHQLFSVVLERLPENDTLETNI